MAVNVRPVRRAVARVQRLARVLTGLDRREYLSYREGGRSCLPAEPVIPGVVIVRLWHAPRDKNSCGTRIYRRARDPVLALTVEPSSFALGSRYTG